MTTDRIELKYKRFNYFLCTMVGIVFYAAFAWMCVAPKSYEGNTRGYNQRYYSARVAWRQYNSKQFETMTPSQQRRIRAYLPPSVTERPRSEVVGKMAEPQWDEEGVAFQYSQGPVGMVLTVGLIPVIVLFLMDLALQQKISVVFDPKGIQFSPIWRTKLRFRLNRSWDDLDTVWIQGNALTRILKWQRYILFTSGGPHIMMEFHSGGCAEITLPMLSREQAEQVFEALRRFCDSEKLSTDVIKLKEALMLGTGTDRFTEIWSDDLEMRHGTTHFQPLPADAHLQGNRYRIISELATGGSSATYIAEDSQKNRVVVKEAVLPIDLDPQQKQAARERFTREAALLMKISHPNVVKVLDCFVEKDRDYLVLERVPGMTLRQLVRMKGAQSESNVREWGAQLAEILSYLHGMQPPLVHRDVTPDNIIVQDDGKIVLIDFGAANEFIGTATGTMIGKQCYVAPEQLRGKAEPSSDVYSFGSTLHFLLTGSDPTPLTCSNPRAKQNTVSDQLARTVEACTSLEPEGRPNSATLVKELGSVKLSIRAAVSQS